MTAYIKFCGGCNEGFSRAAAAERIKKAFSGIIDFMYHDASHPCDIGILIEGCGACCVVRSELAECGRLFELCSDADIDALTDEIKRYINEK